MTQPVSPNTAALEAEIVMPVGKPTANLNMNNLNLNNLDTSLTKELDRTILSAVNSAKNKTQPAAQGLLARKEKSDVSNNSVRKERLDTSTSQREKPSAKKTFSQTPKNEKFDSSLIHARHTSNPDTYDPQFAREKYHICGVNNLLIKFFNSHNPTEKPRKESDVGVHCTTEYTPRQASAFDKFMHNMNKKPVITQSERYHTEGYNNVITEAEVIYESLNSSRRQSPEKVTTSSSAKNSENTIKNTKSPSPKPKAIQTSHQGINKSIYSTYKGINQKTVPGKSPRKVHEKSLNASLERSLKDNNYVGAAAQKKNFASPRAVTAQDKANIYNTLSNRKSKVSASLALTAGALKEKTNNSNVVERLSSHTSNWIFGGNFY